jgi:hypothetical protein
MKRLISAAIYFQKKYGQNFEYSGDYNPILEKYVEQVSNFVQDFYKDAEYVPQVISYYIYVPAQNGKYIPANAVFAFIARDNHSFVNKIGMQKGSNYTFTEKEVKSDLAAKILRELLGLFMKDADQKGVDITRQWITLG